MFVTHTHCPGMIALAESRSFSGKLPNLIGPPVGSMAGLLPIRMAVQPLASITNPCHLNIITVS
jgi:hypothetical protein